MKRVRMMILILLFVIAWVIFVFLHAGYQDAVRTDLSNTFGAVSLEHYFGTDHLGRDIYSLMVDGAVRTWITIGIASVIGLGIGVLTGATAAYYGKTVETTVQFVSDLLMIVPSFILALIFSAVFGLNPVSAGITLGISGIGDYANQAMILTKQIRSRGFVLSEKAMGIGDLRIIITHIVPNMIAPILTALGSRASGIALQYASLSFIGLGADLTRPDWGALLYQYRVYIIDKPMLLFWPSMAIFLLALSAYVLLDAEKE